MDLYGFNNQTTKKWQVCWYHFESCRVNVSPVTQSDIPDDIEVDVGVVDLVPSHVVVKGNAVVQTRQGQIDICIVRSIHGDATDAPPTRKQQIPARDWRVEDMGEDGRKGERKKLVLGKMLYFIRGTKCE